jgi:hypothetical protein
METGRNPEVDLSARVPQTYFPSQLGECIDEHDDPAPQACFIPSWVAANQAFALPLFASHR